MTTTPFVSTLDRVFTLNRALDQVMSQTWGNGHAAPVWVPALDVAEQSDAYVIVADLPGVSPEAIDISFENNVITIRGSKAPAFDANEKELRLYSAERVNGTFERTIRVPEFVDGDRIEASFTHGVLTIRIPKTPKAMPRKIAVSA
jgi:HSP20 family protein